MKTEQEIQSVEVWVKVDASHQDVRDFFMGLMALGYDVDVDGNVVAPVGGRFRVGHFAITPVVETPVEVKPLVDKAFGEKSDGSIWVETEKMKVLKQYLN